MVLAPLYLDCFKSMERMVSLCRHDKDQIASQGIQKPRCPGPTPAQIKIGTVKRTSIIPWIILIPSSHIIPRRRTIFLPGTTLIPTPTEMSCLPIQIPPVPSNHQRNRRKPDPNGNSVPRVKVEYISSKISSTLGKSHEVMLMLRPEDIGKILTTHDLSAYLEKMVQRDDLGLHIHVEYETGELFMNCRGFSNGLSILIDPFGVWVIRETISKENDGVFTQSKDFYKTEHTMTVIRAIARWIRDIEETAGNHA